MQELVEATDWTQALQDGRVTPKAGVDSAFDEAVRSKSQSEAALKVRALPMHSVNVVMCSCLVARSTFAIHKERECRQGAYECLLSGLEHRTSQHVRMRTHVIARQRPAHIETTQFEFTECMACRST